MDSCCAGACAGRAVPLTDELLVRVCERAQMCVLSTFFHLMPVFVHHSSARQVSIIRQRTVLLRWWVEERRGFFVVVRRGGPPSR